VRAAPPSAKILCGESAASCIIAEVVANSIFQILSDFFARYGLWVVFFGVMAENVGMPIPGETVLLFAGFLAFQGRLHLVSAIITAIAGATVGAIGGYMLGRYGGTSVVNRVLARFPRLAKQYNVSQEMFQKYGPWAVFVARFITGLRVFAGILAGVLRMPFWTFLLVTFAGAVCWAAAIGYVGFLFGSSWGTLIKVLGRMDRIALIVLAGCVIAMFIFQKLRRKKSA